MTTARKSRKTTGKEIPTELETAEFIVETILDKRVVNGEVSYFLRWAGYDESYDSWEPAINLEGLALLPEFERQWMEKEKNKASGSGGACPARKSQKVDSVPPAAPASTSGESTDQDNGHTEENGAESTTETNGGSGQVEQEILRWDSSEMNGFDKGLQPEKIIGLARSRAGMIYFLIKWRNEADPGALVTNQVAKWKCPELVFQFYEERLSIPENVSDED